MTLFNNNYSGLITGGLGGDACQGLITMQFHLFYTNVQIIIPGSGGSYPMGPGMIQNFYKPVLPNKTYFPRPPQYQTIIVKVTMKGVTTTREYKTFPVIAKAIAKVINITSIAYDSITVRATNIKTKFASLIVKVKQFGSKREYLNPTIKDVKNKE